MEQPLGFEVGNAGEVIEAMECLRGHGPADLEELCLELAAQVLDATGLPADRGKLKDLLSSGAAYERFEKWVAAQGGDVSSLGQLELAGDSEELTSERAGLVTGIDAELVGRAVVLLGGGRRARGDRIDHGTGVRVLAPVGSRVQAGEPLLLVRHRAGRGLDAARALLRDRKSVV